MTQTDQQEIDQAIVTFHGLVTDTARGDRDGSAIRLAAYVAPSPESRLWGLCVVGALTSADLMLAHVPPDQSEGFWFIDADQGAMSELDADSIAGIRLFIAAMNDDPELGKDILAAHVAGRGLVALVAVLTFLVGLYQQIMREVFP